MTQTNDMIAPPTDIVDGKVLHVFMIDDSEHHWYIATDEEDAFNQFCDPAGAMCGGEAERDDVSITRFDDAQLLTLDIDDENCDPKRTEKTCRAWVEHFGRGFLGSTVC